MKTFDEIYEELQSGDNSKLNKMWQEAKEESEKANKLVATICLIIDIFIIILYLKKIITSGSMFWLGEMTIFVFIIDLSIFVLINAFFNKKQNQYNLEYKKIVINNIMNNFYDNLEYFPQKPMPEYIYKQLEYEYYNKYKSEDYFEAQINKKYSIQMAEVLAQEIETYKDSDGTTKTRTTTKFNGLFAKIQMNKSINSELKIMPNGTFLFDKRLKMDSSEFENYFDVKASNPIIGMQLLTADVMGELIDFENKTKMKYDIVIKGNELYLRFHSGPMFETINIKKGVLDKDTTQKYFYMLNFTYNLSNMLIDLVNETQI